MPVDSSRIENVETLDLLVFIEIARSGSFGRAARTLLIATPSASTRMTRLEEKLGCQLFVRTPRGSQLTAEGRTFLTYAQRTLTILDEAHHAVLSDQSRRAVAAVPASLGWVIFPRILHLWSMMSITGDCRVAHSREAIEFILDGTASIGLVINTPLPASVTGHTVCRSPMRAVVAAEHPLAHADTVSLDDAVSHGVAIYRWGPEAVALAGTFDQTPRAGSNNVHLIGLPSTVLDLVASTAIVGIVPEFAARSALIAGGVVTVPLRMPEWSVEVQLVHRRDASEDISVRALTDNIDVLVSDLALPQPAPSET
ncbi:LysR family transcriptional regulator [Paramicrobacterium fandaimingii]|uniref:LysR family transcriptional regulator n=1 Tax=Paramicrobacterium fandaimingii TaxID=2708079 RepID=UPI0014236662|nr:LysR family transcriptional regulator [Microbacterium fandaimingii]